MLTNIDFVAKLKKIATEYKTLYVMGCFGAPLNTSNKTRYINHHTYNQSVARKKFINAATDDTFGFDCVNLIKGVLWGWDGSINKTYGGAKYISNGVPDVSANGMINLCKNVSTNFSNLEIGEALWVPGHIGIYIGDGLAVECTPSWKNCVQITAVTNLGVKAGYNGRKWDKRGKLPYITYTKVNTGNTLEEDLKVLVDNKVITTPSYWVTKAPTVKYLPELIHNMAEKLRGN